MTFVSGELFERSYELADGLIDVLAEVVADGTRVELRDIAIYPRHAGRLDVPVDRLVGWLRDLGNEARAAGFDELRITATRLSGARTGRRVDLRIQLRGKQP
jgi:hypothetical protein